MYSVSEAYLEQMMHHGTRRRLTGTVGSVPFTGADVVKDSFNITGRATEESDTKIGGVYLGQLEMTFVPSFIAKIPRDQYKDKQVSVSIGLLVTEEGEDPAWVDVPVGVFTLQAPKISKQGISVSGYDNMYKLDKKFNIDQASGTPYGFLSYMATQCGVTLGQSQAEIEALPNGTEVFGIYEENDIETWRDFLYWLAQSCGCFACADRSGNIVLRQFGAENDVEIDEMHRDTDVVFSGYTTKWTGISIVNMATQTTSYYGLEVDDGLTMNLGSNPLLQIGSAIAVERRRRNVLNAIAPIQYVPFYANSARDPVFDLGDEVNFTGGLSGNCKGCVMAYTYTLTNYNFEGYGDDPALANARSKTDKNISGLMQQTAENEVVFYNFANIQELTFGSERETVIASLAFTSAQKTTVKIMHEFIFDMLSDLTLDGSYELKYYYDGELLPYAPYERLGEVSGITAGNNVNVSIARDFFYILKDVEPNTRHTWRVSVTTHNIESTTIGVDHAHVSLEGQRLYGEQYFDGYIEITEEITVIPYGYLVPVAMSDAVSYWMSRTEDWNPQDISENIQLYNISSMQVIQITDTISVIMSGGFPLLSEDGDNLVSEDGDRFVTE